MRSVRADARPPIGLAPFDEGRRGRIIARQRSNLRPVTKRTRLVATFSSLGLGSRDPVSRFLCLDKSLACFWDLAKISY